MIGKAAIGRPWIFRDVAAGLADPGAPGPAGRPDLDELRSVLFGHLADEVERLTVIARKYPLPADALDPEAATVIGFRLHFFRYLSGLKGVAWARGQLCRLRTLDEVRALVDACLTREAEYRARRPATGDASRESGEF
jgi:tRNA-dihydrouridine synthase